MPVNHVEQPLHHSFPAPPASCWPPAGKLGKACAALSFLHGMDAWEVPAIAALLKAGTPLSEQQEALVDKGTKLMGACAGWGRCG